MAATAVTMAELRQAEKDRRRQRRERKLADKRKGG
jgi:uncharacterized membrane protein